MTEPPRVFGMREWFKAVKGHPSGVLLARLLGFPRGQARARADFARGEFRSGLTSFGLAEEGVGYVDDGPHGAGIPAEVKARVAELEARVRRGEIAIPTE